MAELEKKKYFFNIFFFKPLKHFGSVLLSTHVVLKGFSYIACGSIQDAVKI